MRRSSLLAGLCLAACHTNDEPATLAQLTKPDLTTPEVAYRSADLTVGSVTPDAPLTLTLTGASAGETVHFAHASGLGSGPCLGTAGGLCLDIAGSVKVLASADANDDGVATVTLTVPDFVPIGAGAAFQAVIPRGTSGFSWEKSGVVETTVVDAPLNVATMQHGDLVITEVMHSPTAVPMDQGQWFEVYNASGLDMNLDGLQITDFAGTDFTIGAPRWFEAGSYFVFSVNPAPATNGGVDVDVTLADLDLAAAWGEVALFAGATLIDAVAWDDGSAFPAVSGTAMALQVFPDATDNDLADHWQAAWQTYGDGDKGTPGQENYAVSPPEGLPSGDLDAQTLHTQFEREPDYSDGVHEAAPGGDLNGDLFADVIITLANDGGGPGRTYFLYGPFEDTTTSLSDADATLIGEADEDQAGHAASFAGDVNGDGVGDLLVGAPYADAIDDASGVAYLVQGPVGAASSLSDPAARLLGVDRGDRLGTAFAALGDLNQDGFDDFAVTGSLGTTDKAYLIHGPVSGDVEVDLVAHLEIQDADVGTNFGWKRSVAGGDLDGDGVAELVVGDYANDVLANGAGAVYVYDSEVSGVVQSSSWEGRILGEGESDFTGLHVQMGDIDGDGTSDLSFVSYNHDGVGEDSGAVFTFHGPIEGDWTASEADVSVYGDFAGQMLGYGLTMWDSDGDDDDELLMATWRDGAYLVKDLAPGSHDLSQVGFLHIYDDSSTNADLYTVARTGDVDRDGYEDMMLVREGGVLLNGGF